jgi:uncharacterized protein with HEPN domain
MSRNTQLYLDDIREACEKIMRYSQGLDLDQFVQDEKTFDAVVRNLEVIGEAAKHIPPEIRACYPDIEWNKLAGLRDIVAHKYFGLDEDILWDVIQHRIPALLDRVRQILAAKGEQ